MSCDVPRTGGRVNLVLGRFILGDFAQLLLTDVHTTARHPLTRHGVHTYDPRGVHRATPRKQELEYIHQTIRNGSSCYDSNAHIISLIDINNIDVAMSKTCSRRYFIKS